MQKRQNGDPFDWRVAKPRSIREAKASGKAALEVIFTFSASQHPELRATYARWHPRFLSIGEKIGEEMYREGSVWTMGIIRDRFLRVLMAA